MNTNNTLTIDHQAIAPDPDRHARLGAICRHPDRDHIDFDFVQWGNPDAIVRQYHLRHRSTLYRHARATGLFFLRSRNVRSALDHVIERISRTPVDASAAVQAVRIYAHINDSGSWVEPTRRILIAEEIPVPEQYDLVLDPSLAASLRARDEAIAADERERKAAREREQLAAQQAEPNTPNTPNKPQPIAAPQPTFQNPIPRGSAKCFD